MTVMQNALILVGVLIALAPLAYVVLEVAGVGLYHVQEFIRRRRG